GGVAANDLALHAGARVGAAALLGRRRGPLARSRHPANLSRRARLESRPSARPGAMGGRSGMRSDAPHLAPPHTPGCMVSVPPMSNNAPLKLYTDTLWISPYVFSCFVALHEKGLPFETAPIALQDREQHDPTYRDRSLTARVPAIDDGGFWLSESQ